jgi:hypothetical protein
MHIRWQPFFETPEKPGGVGVQERGEKFDDDVSLMDNLIANNDRLRPSDEETDLERPAPEKDVITDSDTELGKGEPEDLITESSRGISLAKVKENFPEFARTAEFKELRNAYYREAKYTELFPTLEDAQEAAENNETFEILNKSVIGYGDPTQLMLAIRNTSPQAFKSVALSFMDILGRMDNNTYVEAVTPMVKRLARQIYAQGQRYLKHNEESPEGQALVGTARNILLYAFPDEDADRMLTTSEARPNQQISERERALAERENQIIVEKYRSAYQICSTSVERHLDRIIGHGLDPDGKLSEFTKDALIEKIKNEVKSQIDKDGLHARRMTSLWKRSQQSDYSRESLSSIVSAYLERARPIIPTIRSKFRALAGASSSDDTDVSVRIPRRGTSGRPAERDGKINLRAVDAKKIDYNKTTDADIFEGRVKLKG